MIWGRGGGGGSIQKGIFVFKQYFSHLRLMEVDNERLSAMEPHWWKRFLPPGGLELMTAKSASQGFNR